MISLSNASKALDPDHGFQKKRFRNNGMAIAPLRASKSVHSAAGLCQRWRKGDDMRIAVALPLLASATSAVAAPAPVVPPPPVTFFVSPIGEPFRAGANGGDPVLAWFRQADADGNGALSVAELQADADRFFATLDSNRDGEIDPGEISRYEREVAPEIQLGQQIGGVRWGESRRSRKDERRERERDRDGLQGAGRFAWLNIPEPVAAADADLNRGVSRAEFTAAAAERLRKLDSNGDGALTLAELPPLPQQRSEDEKKKARKTPKPVEGIAIPPE
jgi:hypothetical protein